MTEGEPPLDTPESKVYMKRFSPTGVAIIGLVMAIVSGQSQTSQQPPAQRVRPDFEEALPVYINGVVVLEDGRPVPGVRVELLIGGTVLRQEFTGSDGSFIFDISTSSPSPFADASASTSPPVENSNGTGRTGASGPSVSRSMNRIEGIGWEVRAISPGYVSDKFTSRSRGAVTVVLHPLAHVKATTISLNSLKAPKKAVERYASARKALQKKNPDQKKAIAELEKALAEFPDYSEAWQTMGEIRLSQKDNAGARTAFEKALATDAQYLLPYLSLASLDVDESRWAEAADMSSKLIELNPYVTHGHFLNAVANFSLGRYDLVERSIEEVQKQDEKRYPFTHYLLGAMAADRGDLNKAAKEFQAYLDEQPNSPYTERVKQTLDQWREQGIAAAAKKH